MDRKRNSSETDVQRQTGWQTVRLTVNGGRNGCVWRVCVCVVGGGGGGGRGAEADTDTETQPKQQAETETGNGREKERWKS